MAQSSGFRNRISLEGDAEVKAKFAQVERAGESAFSGIRSAVDDSGRGFLRFRGNLDSVTGSFSSVVSASSSLKTALAGAFALEGLGRLKEQFSQVLEGMRQLQNVSAGTGFSTDAVKAFGQAVEQTGVIGEKVGPALVQYAGTLADARAKADDLSVSTQGGVSVFRGFGQAVSGAANEVKDSTTGASDGLIRLRSAMNDTVTVGNSLVQVFRGGVQPSAAELDTPFKVLGIDVRRFTKDSAGQAASLEAVARAFVKLKTTNPAAAIRAASLLFGEDDITKFSSALDRIAEIGLPKFKQESQALGRLPSDEQQQALRQYDIAWANLRGTVEAALRPAITSVLPALTTLLNGAAGALEAVRKAFLDAGATTAVQAWAESLRSEVQPALADVATLITRTFDPKNIQPLRTDFGRNLVSGFQAAHDTLNLVISAFKGLIAAADAALAPVNAVFGTKFRGDVILGVAALLKVIGGFAAIEAAIGLAKTALLAFTTLAARTPFGLLAAAVAIFVSNLAEGTETAQKFWASITGDSSEAAKAVGDTANKATEFGNAAANAEQSVAKALGTTQRLGDAAAETGGKFVNVATSVPKIADALPAVQRGVERVGGAVDQVRGKFVDVVAETQSFRKEVDAASKATTPITAPAAGAKTPAAIEPTAKPLADRLTDVIKQPVIKVDPILDDINHLIAATKAAISGDWTNAWNEAGTVAQNAIDDTRKVLPGLADALERGVANIKGIDWKRFFNTGFDTAESQAVADIEGIRLPLPKFLDDWLASVKERMAELKKLQPLGSDPSFVGAAGTAPPPGFLSGWTEAVAKWNADTKSQIEANFAEIGPPSGSSLGPKLAEWANDAVAKVADTFKKIPIGAGPEFLGDWLPAVTKFGNEASKDLSDDFSRLDVPAQPGFLATWGTSIQTWVSGQVDEIKTALGAISIPSPISSAAAATLPAGGLDATTAPGTVSTTDTVTSATKSIDDAKAQLRDLITSIPTTISDALNQVSQLVTDSLDKLNEFVQGRSDALTEFAKTALQTVSDLITTTLDTLNGGFETAFNTLQISFDSVAASINSQIETISSALSTLKDTAASVASAVGGAVGSVSDTVPGFAGGGHIRGPGTSTSDDVLIAASTGEHVTRARAVSYYGPRFFDLINRMAIPRDMLRQILTGLQGFSLGGLVGGLSQPIVNFSIPRFAQGGLVTAPAAAAAAAGGSSATFVLDGRSHQFFTDADTLDSFTRAIRKKKYLKA